MKSKFIAAAIICALAACLQAADVSIVSKWSVQVERVDPGGVEIQPAFREAIYENLVQELQKSKQFKQVFRSGDRNATDASDLLILKTTIEAYTPGSETKRAVTTVAGATKLSVRSQLVSRDGKVILEKVVNGNVRLFGGNLRATHVLAHNVSQAMMQGNSSLGVPGAREVASE